MPASPFDSKLALILDSISDGVYVTTDEREIVYWNSGAERITGYSAAEAVGSHCYDNLMDHTDVHGGIYASRDVRSETASSTARRAWSARCSSSARTANDWRST